MAAAGKDVEDIAPAAEAEDSEEKREGCALEKVTEMAYEDRKEMRMIQLSQVATIAGLVYLMTTACLDGRWGIFIGYLVVCSMPATIRSIMDWKYDTMGLEGREKNIALLKYALLNFSQWRIFHDARECYKAGSIGMSLNMSLMVFSLLRVVPQLTVNLVNLMLIMREPVRGMIEITTCVYITTMFFEGSWTVAKNILNFELVTNAAAAAPKKQRLRVYFICDVLVRTVSFGMLTTGIIANPDVPNGVAVLPILTLFVNRCVLMSMIYITRGYIYPPEAPATKDTTTVGQKVIFGIFPAGFVQTFTDFPFNGDLSSRKLSFGFHQFLSLNEACVCAALTFLVCDLPNLLAVQWATYAILSLWIAAWTCKLIAFPVYWSVRVGRNHAQALRKVAGVVEVKQGHEKFVAGAPFALYIKNHCPDCEKASALLKKHSAHMALRNIDEPLEVQREELIAFLDTVGEIGAKLMPLNFHNKEYIGSLPELEKLIAESGPELFEGSGAVEKGTHVMV